MKLADNRDWQKLFSNQYNGTVSAAAAVCGADLFFFEKFRTVFRGNGV